MLRTYLHLAFRHLRKNSLTALINVLGLAVAVLAYLLILQHVGYERSYDTFHSNAERIYRVDSEFAAGDQRERYASNYYGVAEAMEADFPEVEAYTTLHGAEVTIQTDIDNYHEDKMFLVDSNFAEFFSFPLIAGELTTALDEPSSAVISKRAAEKYFGDQDPVGQVLRYNDGGEINVKAVVDVPQNSHVDFNVVVNASNYINRRYRQGSGLWNWSNFYVYVRLQEGADPAATAAKFPQLLADHKPDDDEETAFYLVPLLDIHLNSNLEDELSANGSSQIISILLLVAFAILFIGWINYVNLATAQATDRAREVGVRKVVGAQRKHLLGQFFVQSVVVNSLAVILAVGLFVGLRTQFSHLLGHSLDFSYVSTQLLQLFVGVFLVGAIVSGLYPAFLMSAVQPTNVLKGQLTKQLSGLWARRGLTVFQFAASILLIAGTFAVYRQVSFMQSQDLGFDSEQVLVLKGPQVGPEDYGSAYRPLRNQMLQLPEVTSMSAAGSIPSQGYNATLSNVRPSGWADGTGLLFDFVIVDENYLNTFDIELIAGRNFSLQQDTSTQAVIVNEAAARQMGFTQPADLVGQNILWQSTENENTLYRVVGITADYHHQSLQRSQDELVIVYDPLPEDYYALKVNTENVAATIQKVEQLYQGLFPGNPFQHFFLDEAFAAQYEADVRLGNTMLLFGGLAIFIACLGLFGLASFTAIRKMKEVGIRKVLGASLSNIVYLFTREFIGLIVVAAIVGIPLAYFMIGRWLENYAYAMPLTLGLFLTPVLILLVISLLTISYHTLRTAFVNPVDHLRQES